MNLDSEQSAALDLLQSGENVFLTGSAGTGKSTVTTAFVASAFRKVDIAATTGIASINLRDKFASDSGGRMLNVSTIYRWGGFGLGPKKDQSHESFYEWWRAPMSKSKMGACHRIRSAECLVIDEISMFPGRMVSYLDYHCRRIRSDARPFGGIQIVCVGDFLQLPPVDKEGTGYDWAFLSETWRAANFRPAVLRKVHRQDEREFVDLLNEFRVGRISAKSMHAMGRRVTMFCDSSIPRLFTHNAAVDKWNSSQLDSLPGEKVEFTARIQGGVDYQREWLLKNLVTPYHLHLKPGARVMVTANITKNDELAASNGTLAKVLSIDEENGKAVIQTDDGTILELGRWMWDFDPQDDDSAKFWQIPLRLAWASTIHKAQGLTLDRAWIDIRAAREPGQAYVALSRVRTLAGLHLKSVPGGTFVSPAAVSFHESLNSVATPAKPEPAPQPEPEVCLY